MAVHLTHQPPHRPLLAFMVSAVITRSGLNIGVAGQLTGGVNIDTGIQ